MTSHIGTNPETQRQMIAGEVQVELVPQGTLVERIRAGGFGLGGVFIACVDGLKGFPDAMEAVFPQTEVQLCIVHRVRHSLNFVGWKQRKPIAADLWLTYTAATENQAQRRLTEFEAKWDGAFASIGPSWRRNWSRLSPFFDCPADIRKVIYTTNAIESVNMKLPKSPRPGDRFRPTMRCSNCSIWH